MKQKGRKRILIITIIVIIILAATAFIISANIKKQNNRTASYPEYGQIYLYGEEHANEAILEKELELWHFYYYENGMRHLFVELPYYTAEYLNLWMQSDNDSILEQLYQDWDGTAIHSEAVLDFYMQIKSDCPETVFHGTDVGHQYDTTGARYLEYLENNNLQDSLEYQLTLENIEQGKKYYNTGNNIYRENTLVDNFVREFENLNGEGCMGIYGSAHTGTESKDIYTNLLPCMANQLKDCYGANLHSEDLSLLANNAEAIRIDTISVAGKEYEATYYRKMEKNRF